MKEEAEGQVRTSLVLEAIAEAEKLEATDEDVDNELAKMAEVYKMEVDAIKKALGNLDAVKGDLTNQKSN